MWHFGTKHQDSKSHAQSAVAIRKDIKHLNFRSIKIDHTQTINSCIEDWYGGLMSTFHKTCYKEEYCLFPHRWGTGL